MIFHKSYAILIFMLKSLIVKTDKKIFGGKFKKIYHYLNHKKEYEKKIKNLNLKFNRNEKKIILLSDLLKKSPEDGVIVECGVGVGFSLTVIANLSKKMIYAFDSFSGFPDKISEKDKSKNDTQNLLKVLKYSKFHYKLMSIDVVKKNLVNNGVNEKNIENNIKFIKGFFPDSFGNFNEKISFLHLDVDLYDSYKECLKFFFPKMINGGIITFDEYIEDSESSIKKGYGWHGAKVAINEFVKINNLNLMEHSTGFKYIVIN